MARRNIAAIYEEINKLKAKIDIYQRRLDALEKQKTELENLQIVERIRAVCLTPKELAEFIKTGDIPEREVDSK